MNRKKGLALTLTGAVLAVVSLLGVFAAVTDTADSGSLEVESAAEGTALDLRLRDTVLTSSSSDCENGPHVDTQTVEPLTLTGATPGSTLTRFVCLRNFGDETADISLELVNTSDVEVGCNVDEPLLDPDGPGCGTAGELADDIDLTVGYQPNDTDDCDNSIVETITYDGIADTAVQPFGPAAFVTGGDAVCVRVQATYDPATPVDEVVQNQEDEVTWQLRFHADLQS